MMRWSFIAACLLLAWPLTAGAQAIIDIRKTMHTQLPAIPKTQTYRYNAVCNPDGPDTVEVEISTEAAAKPRLSKVSGAAGAIDARLITAANDAMAGLQLVAVSAMCTSDGAYLSFTGLSDGKAETMTFLLQGAAFARATRGGVLAD